MTSASPDMIAVSSDGISFPYRRLLTDASTGILGLLVAIAYWSYEADVPSMYSSLDAPSRLAAIVTVGFLALPVGVVISCVSLIVLSAPMFFLEWIIATAIFCWPFRLTILLPLHRLTNTAATFDFFEIGPRNYFTETAKLTAIAEIVFPHAGERFRHLEGVCILCRNTSALLLVTAFLPHLSGRHFQVLVAASLVLLFSSSYVCVLSRADILFRFRLVVPDTQDERIGKEIKKRLSKVLQNHILKDFADAKPVA